MKVSVIIPCYNRSHTLARALDSVLAQSYLADEIIVVDDASTDDTSNLLQAYPTVKVISLEKNRGVSAARNRGIAAASNDWISLLDSDDAWALNKLEQQIRAQAESQDLKIFHCDEIWIRNGKRVNPMKKHAKPDGWIYQASLALCCVSPSSILFHRSVLTSCGDFDEELPACEDYDLWLRLFSRYPIKLIDEALVYKYGGHADQLSHQYWGMDRFRVRALDKILASGVLDEEQTQDTLAVLKKKCEILVQGAVKRGNTQLAQEYTAIAQGADRRSPQLCHT